MRLLKHHFKWFLHEALRHHAVQDKPTVVFVRRSARSRIYNHALSLQDLGIQSILVAQAFDYPYHKEVFSEIHPWYRVNKIPDIVKRLTNRYKVTAIISSLQPSSQTLELLKHQWSVPLFIDHHDSAWSQVYFQNTTMVNNQPSDAWTGDVEINNEKHCFSHVDGVIARSQELVELFEENSVATPIEVFEDCCCEQYFEPVRLSPAPKNNEWSVAYAGMVFPMSHDPCCAFPQFVDAGPVFEREKIHFHIFPGQHHEYIYPDYDAESARNKYFHMHRSVDFGEIRKVLSAYDFGLVAFNLPEEYQLFSPVHFRHILHAKFHTYLEAGLPIIVSKGFVREAEIIEQYQAGIVVDMATPDGLKAIIESVDVAQLRKNVIRLREDFLAGRQGQRLATFTGIDAECNTTEYEG